MWIGLAVLAAACGGAASTGGGSDDSGTTLDVEGAPLVRTVDGQVLTFEPQGDDTFVDRETGTTWDLLGKAIAGSLEGKQLTPAVHTNELWFAWAAFNPDAEVYGGDGEPAA